MIEFILSTLVEFGLIREDYVHQKRISKKEKEDGVKRPFQKYLMQPSAIIYFVILVIIISSVVLFFTYQRKSIFPKETEIELLGMTDRMNNWHEKLGYYPTDLKELIGNSPMRQDWETDAWDRPYNYTITNDGLNFEIISAGSDGKFETDDDIKSK